IFLGLGVEAVLDIVLLEELTGDDGAVPAGVLGDLANRRLQRAADDIDAAGLVVVLALEAVERLRGIEQRNAAARNDSFLDRGAGGVKRVADAILALLPLDLGGSADLDHRNAAGEFRQPLLQLLTVLVGGRGLDLRTDRSDAALDI